MILSRPDDSNDHNDEKENTIQQDPTPDTNGHSDNAQADIGKESMSDQGTITNSTSDNNADPGENYSDNKYSENIQDTHTASKSTAGPMIIGLVIAIGAAAFFAGAYIMNMDQNQQDVDYITQQELDDAMAKIEMKILQVQLAEKQLRQQMQQLQQQQPPPVVQISADDDPVIGDPNAYITIIEFSDFQCPYCARFSEQVLPQIHEKYIETGIVKLVYRDFPLQSHPNAVITALAAECADDQGMFKGMHDALFENQREWSGASSNEILGMLTGYASNIGISTDEFESCIASGTHIDDIRKDLEDGRSYGMSGTPGFYIGNDEIGYVSIQGAQPFEIFERVIDAQIGS